MRFPRRISLLLGKIVLDRVMSPDRVDELIEEIRLASVEISSWWNEGGSGSTEEVVTSKVLDVSIGDESIADGRQALATRFEETIGTKLEERSKEQELSETLVSEIIQSVLVGVQKTWVIWLDLSRLSGPAESRYVHFSYSWDKGRQRFGYRIRDFENDVMYLPHGSVGDRNIWTLREVDQSAEEVWNRAGRRIATNKETGLGGRLGSVDDNNSVWKEVLNALTKNLPGDRSHDRGT